VELRPITVTEAALSTKYAATSIPIKEVPTITTEICVCDQRIQNVLHFSLLKVFSK
jgi:hypothetical protein